MVFDVAQRGRTWVRRTVQAYMVQVGRKFTEPRNKVSPTPAGAEGHTIGGTSGTRTRSDQKLQAVENSSLTRRGRLLKGVAGSGTEVRVHKVECNNRHMKNPIDKQLTTGLATHGGILAETPRTGNWQGEQSGGGG